MNARTDLVDKLTAAWESIPALAEVWVTTTAKEMSSFSRVTAIVSARTIEPFPPAPNAYRIFGLTIEIVSPIPDLDDAIDELEEIVVAILDYLDPEYQHGDAELFTYGELLAYRIPISITALKEN